MTLILADKDDPRASLEYQIDVTQDWYSAFNALCEAEHERHKAMRDLMAEFGSSDFDPRRIAFFQSIISQKHNENSPIFLSDADVLNGATAHPFEDDTEYRIGKSILYFPRYDGKRRDRNGLPMFAFLTRPAASSSFDTDKNKLLQNVKSVTSPAVIFRSELIEALREIDCLHEFVDNIKTIIDVCNHDWIHGLTNPNRLTKIPEGFDYKSKTCLRQFVNPDIAGNRLRVEECAVMEMNRMVFERLRNQSDNLWYANFLEALGLVTGIINNLQKKNQAIAAQSATFVLRSFLGFFFDKNHLDPSHVVAWKDLVRDARTRQDIRLAEYTKQRFYEPTVFATEGNQTSAPPPKKKPTKLTDEDSRILSSGYNWLLNGGSRFDGGSLSLVDPRRVFQVLGEATDHDLNRSLYINEKARRLIVDAANNRQRDRTSYGKEERRNLFLEAGKSAARSKKSFHIASKTEAVRQIEMLRYGICTIEEGPPSGESRNIIFTIHSDWRVDPQANSMTTMETVGAVLEGIFAFHQINGRVISLGAAFGEMPATVCCLVPIAEIANVTKLFPEAMNRDRSQVLAQWRQNRGKIGIQQETLN